MFIVQWNVVWRRADSIHQRWAICWLPGPDEGIHYLANACSLIRLPHPDTTATVCSEGGGRPALIYDSPRAITLPLTLIQQFIYWHACRYRQRWAAYMQETGSWTLKLQIGSIFPFRWERARGTWAGCNNHLMPCCCCSASADTDSALSVIRVDRRNESRLRECRCSAGQDERRPLARSPARRHGWSVPPAPLQSWCALIKSSQRVGSEVGSRDVTPHPQHAIYNLLLFFFSRLLLFNKKAYMPLTFTN